MITLDALIIHVKVHSTCTIEEGGRDDDYALEQLRTLIRRRLPLSSFVEEQGSI